MVRRACWINDSIVHSCSTVLWDLTPDPRWPYFLNSLYLELKIHCGISQVARRATLMTLWSCVQIPGVKQWIFLLLILIICSYGEGKHREQTTTFKSQTSDCVRQRRLITFLPNRWQKMLQRNRSRNLRPWNHSYGKHKLWHFFIFFSFQYKI